MMDPLKTNLAILIPLVGTDREVAELLDVQQSSVWRWRKGHTAIQETYLVRLANAAGVSPALVRYGDLSTWIRDRSRSGP